MLGRVKAHSVLHAVFASAGPGWQSPGRMSNLDSLDLDDIADLVSYPRGPGFVLHFSDATFRSFFQSEFRINIDEDRFKGLGTSKGKRLRSFLTQAKDGTALRALETLWRHRVAQLRRNGENDPFPDAEARVKALTDKLGGLKPATPPSASQSLADPARIAALKTEIVRITGLAPQPRGYAFEVFLKDLFNAYGLRAREAFRNRGEQIDGSFVLDGAIYLLEAKWQNLQTGVADLRAFEGKLQDKAGWARGLFLSQSGFTEDGLVAFGRGKRTICMDGLDLYEMLDRSIPFDAVVDRKSRRAAESGEPFVRVRDLF